VNAQTKRSWLAIGVVIVLVGIAFGINRATSSSGSNASSAQHKEQVALADLPDCPASTGAGKVGGGLPALTLPCLGNGPKVNLAKLRGPIVLNVWAGPCPPCKAEAPLVQQFYAAAKGKIGVLGVVDGAYPAETWDDALNASHGLGLHYPSVFDAHGKLIEQVHAGGIPITVFVGADGKVVHTKIGQLKDGELARLAKQYFEIDVNA